MIPSLMLLGVGPGCRFPFPFPVFLLWPLLAVFALVLALCTPFAPAQRLRDGWQALRAFGQLRGLKIDVVSNDGSRVLVWFV